MKVNIIYKLKLHHSHVCKKSKYAKVIICKNFRSINLCIINFVYYKNMQGRTKMNEYKI